MSSCSHTAERPGAATWAGAAVGDITPAGSVFLFGYPHVPRASSGVHDPLECAALYIRAEHGQALFIANDLIYFARDFAREVRRRIARATGVPATAVVLTATHTHSGPVMTNTLSNAGDTVVPPADEAYLRWLADRIVDTADRAARYAVPAEVGLALAHAEGVGTNRHDPMGPTDAAVPVLVARAQETREEIGCMVVYGMHPTVLHEDSLLISADFPGFARNWLRDRVLPPACPVIYHQGASGNQSPRHVTTANTFAEAQRIGENLGRAVAAAVEKISYGSLHRINAREKAVVLEPRQFPDVTVARKRLQESRERFAALKSAGAPRQDVRTAECDVFGAEKTEKLACAAADGRLAAAIAAASPADIQMIELGPWRFAAWPGEFFVEHALALKAMADVYVITLANGELQGYIATPEAVARRAYEATNAIFSVENGPRFVKETLALLNSSTEA